MICTYPDCNCPFDMPEKLMCARGLPMKDATKTKTEDRTMTRATTSAVDNALNETASPRAKIDFTPSNYALIAKGKRTTIRLGDKNYVLGGVDFTVGKANSEYCPVITEIRKLRFSRLTLQDALDDGYNSLNALREELQSCYGKFISDREIVTIVRFEV
ncbi:ASCH domain-containing protein [Neptuniibacter pectenicola]|uniref:ASCH domain-containing protein n=1 Tax=Neptuniibacter pectenicola TaxID=1806669 RepID=UPI00082D8C6B|nr:ASCH domain-containing protein [Neptuniibacter pectenicola]